MRRACARSLLTMRRPPPHAAVVWTRARIGPTKRGRGARICAITTSRRRPVRRWGGQARAVTLHAGQAREAQLQGQPCGDRRRLVDDRRRSRPASKIRTGVCGLAVISAGSLTATTATPRCLGSVNDASRCRADAGRAPDGQRSRARTITGTTGDLDSFGRASASETTHRSLFPETTSTFASFAATDSFANARRGRPRRADAAVVAQLVHAVSGEPEAGP